MQAPERGKSPLALIDTRRLHCVLDELDEDPQASRHIGIGMLLVTLPVVNLAALGYQVELARLAARGPLRVMPRWDDFGQLFRIGLGLALARWLYALPGYALLASAALVLFGPLLAAALEGGLAGAANAALLTPGQAGAAAVFMLGYAFYELAYALLASAITLQYVQGGRLRECFRLSALAAYVRQRRLRTVSAWLSRGTLGLGGRMLLTLTGLVLNSIPILGTVLMFLTLGWLRFFTLLVRGHMLGQLLREDVPAPPEAGNWRAGRLV